MAGEIVVVLGAGATKACGGPLTNEILPWAFRNPEVIHREDYVPDAVEFIRDIFGMDPLAVDDLEARLPSLTLILSLIDIAIDRREALSPKWRENELGRARSAFDYIIFAVLEHQLHALAGNPHKELFRRIRELCGDVSVLSLNYDIIADNSLLGLAEHAGLDGFADYGCDIASDFYRERPKIGQLFKLHGSLNWMYCPNCTRLDLGVSESGRSTAKVLDALWQESPEAGSLEQRYTCHGSPCRTCGTYVNPMLISPSHQKDYRNPHIVEIWRRADMALRQARQLIFVGYSLPEDDIHVQYLLKRAAGHLHDGDVTVVEFDPVAKRPAAEHPVGRRYSWLFGDGIRWCPDGFQEWLQGPEAI